MKQRSIVLALAAIAVTASAGAQQTPPTPPTVPTPTTPPVAATAPTPVTAPTTATAPIPAIPGSAAQSPLVRISRDPFIVEIDREAIRRATDEARWAGQFAAEEGRRAAEQARQAMEDVRWELHGMAPINLDVTIPKFSSQAFVAPIPFSGQHFTSGSHEVGPPPSFGLQGDPADSIYNLGREAFNRQDYSRAAARFAEMIAKYPNSKQVSAAAYYQAFALYRVGTLESLRTALKVLESNEQRFAYDNNRSYRNDAPALQARVLRALADRKEPSADDKLRDLIAKYPAVSCDKDKIEIQSQVLNALYATDPQSAMPYIQQNLATRDACSAGLRENAIWQLGKRPSEESTNLIVQIAKTDTVRSVRARAIEVLSRMPGDAAIVALQQFMGDSDVQIQSAAVRSLMRSDNPKARAAMRALIDRRESPERQRLDAIRSFDRDMAPEDAAYLRTLFNRQGESDRVKDAIITAIAQNPNEENMKFLLDVAQNVNESSSIRANALRAVTRRQNISTDNLIKLYDAADARSMRQSLVEALGQRPEPAAVNKLLNIVQYSTDPEVRSNAIQILLRKNDKAITQKVLDLIK